MQNRVAAAMEQPYEDLRSQLENAPQVVMDETPTQQANEKGLQWCWSHWSRDIQALVEHQDHQVKRLGYDLKRHVGIMFSIWHRYQSGEICRETFKRKMRPVRDRVNSLLLRGACSGNKRLKGMCMELCTHRNWLWTFVDVQDIEPTNNTAERAASCGDLSQTLLRNSKRSRQSIHRTNADHLRNLPPPEATDLSVAPRSRPFQPQRRSPTKTTHRP